MGSSDDVVRTFTIKTVSDGAPEATKDLQDLAAAQQGVAVASDTATKSTISAASALNKLQNSIDPSYRASTQLSGAQATLGKAFDQGLVSVDRYNQLMVLAGQRFDDVSKKATPLTKAFDSFSDKLKDSARDLGPLGTALAGIGPVGIAVGGAIGLAALAFDKLKESANEAGQWAQQLQQSANVIGLNTTELQGLNEAASKVGVSAQDNVSAFEKFSVSLGQLKDGSGSLYAELLKVNPALVSQLSVTKDSATAWNLLAKAYSSANAQQQALITRAAFGRGGAAQGPVLQATADAGGISNLSNEDAVSTAQIKKWADLTTQINSATEAATHNFQSIFTTEILEREKAFADNLLNISRYAKDFSISDDMKYYLSKLGSAALGAIPFVGPIVQGVAGLANAATTPGSIPSPTSSQSPLPPAPNFDATFSAVGKSNSAAVTASLGVQASQAKALVSALGGAATAQDKLDATTKQLNVDLANHTITQETYNKALAGANLDAAIAKQSLYNSTLGELATTSDLVAAKSLSLQKAQQQGVGLTDTQTAAVKNLTAANSEWAQVNGQAQIGIFNLAAATKAAGDQFQSWIDKKYLDPSNPEQYAAALQAMANKIQATSDAAKVAGSAFPQLTQLGLDAGNVNKQFDTFATTSANAVAPALEGILNGTMTLSAGFKNLGQSIVTALEDATIKLLIIKPLVNSVLGGASGGGLLSLLGIGSTAGTVAANGSIVGAVGATSVGGAPLVAATGLHAGGMVGSEATFGRYVHPAYFDDAPRFHTGGIAGDEVPIIAKKGEGVFTQGQMAAMGGTGDTHNYYINAPGADSGTVQQLKAATKTLAVQLKTQTKAMRIAQRFQATGVGG